MPALPFSDLVCIRSETKGLLKTKKGLLHPEHFIVHFATTPVSF